MKSGKSLVLGAALVSSTALAQNKDSYHLFRPTPDALLRDFSPGRPDSTDNPYTVDAGRVQLEVDLLSASGNIDGGFSEHSQGSAGLNFIWGLTRNTHLEIGLTPWVRESQMGHGVDEWEEGLGDTTVRVKWNLFGNDEGPIAIALLPFVKAPTAQGDLGNNKFEGGLSVPISLELPAGFELGLMLRLAHEKNETNDGFHRSFLVSSSLSRAIYGELGTYIESVNSMSSDDEARYVSTVGTGFTYGLRANLQLDVGVSLGLTKAATDWESTTGFSWRI